MIMDASNLEDATREQGMDERDLPRGAEESPRGMAPVAVVSQYGPMHPAARDIRPVLGCDPRDAMADGDDVADVRRFAEALVRLHRDNPRGYDTESATAEYLKGWVDHENRDLPADGDVMLLGAYGGDVPEFAFEMRLLLNRLRELGVGEDTRARAAGEAFLRFMGKALDNAFHLSIF